MKKITLLIRLVIALAVAAAIPLTARAAINQILYTANYNGTPVLGNDTLGGVTYSTVTYGGLYNGGDPGNPSLPIDYIRFSVPYNATNFTVTASWLPMYLANYNLSHLVYPCQPLRLMNDTTPVVIALPDTSAYFMGGTYPSQSAWVVDEGFLDGENHIVTVAVMPFAYTHTSTTDKVTLRRKLNVKLQYSLSDSLAMYPIIRNDSALREEGYSLARSLVINPSQVKTFAPIALQSDFDSIGINLNGGAGNGINGGIFPGFDPPDPTPVDTTELGGQEMHVTGDFYPYLIVTTSNLLHSVRRIAALKRQKGYDVKIVTMDQVMNDPNARDGDRIKQSDGTIQIAYNDSAGVLRQFLKEYYQKHGTKYVLFVGDIPYRCLDAFDFESTANIDSATIVKYYNNGILTDSYFADLNSNWTNMNKERQPELYVGRIPASICEQVENYTDKLFWYSLNPGNGDVSYLQNAFFSEGRDFYTYQTGLKNSLLQIFPNQIIINDPPNNNSAHPKGKDIIDALNSNPVGFISIFNHGGKHDIMVHGTKDNLPIPRHYISYIENKDTITGNGLDCLKNKYKPMIFYSTACHTIPFDIKNTMNFGESFITGKDYGGPVYIGYTREVYDLCIRGIAEAFANRINDGYHGLGEAFTLTKIDGQYTFESFLSAFFGDPELELWTNTPQEYNTVQVTRTDSVVTISCIDILPSRISYMTKNNLMTSKLVNSQTVRLTNASPNSTIMLYKHDCIPYIAPLLLQNTNINTSQYVIAKDVSAGYSVDNKRLLGDVTVKNGTRYEIEAQGSVTLHGGFKVEKGATFAVYPSSF